MDFIGEKCVRCGEAFTADDDVVVCPECGSPHHRACYKAENKCANELWHAEGKVWERSAATAPPPESEQDDDYEGKECPLCHCMNAGDAAVCENCGVSLDGVEREKKPESGSGVPPFGIPRPYLGFDPNEDMGGATLKDVSDFVRTNTIYYIPLFKRMKDTGRSISFNLISFIFPPLYFANRRMWFWAMTSLIISVLLSLPFAISYLVTDGIENGYSLFSAEITEYIYANRAMLSRLIDICNISDMLMRVIFCLFSNKLYYRFALKHVKRIRARIGEKSGRSEIAYAGGVKPLNALLIMIISIALSFASVYGTVQILGMIAQ